MVVDWVGNRIVPRMGLNHRPAVSSRLFRLHQLIKLLLVVQLVVRLLLLLVLIELTNVLLYSLAVIHFVFLLLLSDLVKSLSLVYLRKDGVFVSLLAIALIDVILILQLEE